MDSPRKRVAIHNLRILSFLKVTARVQSNYFPTDIGCRLLPPPQSNISDTTLNYRIETYYNNDDLVPDFIPKNSSNLNQVKEDLFGNFGSFKNVSYFGYRSEQGGLVQAPNYK